MRNPRANLPDRDGWYTDRPLPRKHTLAVAIFCAATIIGVASIAYTVWP